MHLRNHIKTALKNLPEGVDIDDIADSIVMIIGAGNYLEYEEHEAPILTLTGRVLVSILESPTITQKALGDYLGVTEGMINKVIANLVQTKVITKTKQSRQNGYSVNFENLQNHPDIQHVAVLVLELLNMGLAPKP